MIGGVGKPGSRLSAQDLGEILGVDKSALGLPDGRTFDSERIETFLGTTDAQKLLDRMSPKPTRSWVYFMRRTDGLVKIGVTTDPERRLRALQNAGGPMDLVAWFEGDAGVEKALHDRFASTRVVGEWFSPSDALEELIRAKSQGDSELALTTAETCERLKVSRTTVWRLVQAGKLTPVRVTQRTTLYSAAEVERFASTDPDDHLGVLKAAFSFLSEAHAEDERELCPQCTLRRVNRGRDWCTYCEERYELQKSHKRKWWNEKGTQLRTAQRQAEAQAADG
jgi:excisionase family DNA binding protein